MIYVHSLGRAFRYYTQRTALVVDGAAVSFKALHERVQNIAAALAAQGFSAGDRLALLLPNSPEYIELVYACSWLGVTAVPINARLSAAEIERVLLDANPRGLVRHSSLPRPTVQLPWQLDALGGMASHIRGKLGESLASARRFDTPLENVTTSSLEALQAYTLTHAAQASNGPQGGNPLYERAIQLDPNFATAYLGMGVNYFNMDEPTRAAECLQKAYDLRERVSEREKLGIETVYEAVGLGDFDAAVKTNLLAMQLYPRDPRATANLGTFYSYLGDYEKALSSIQETLKRNGGAGQSYSNLLVGYLHVGRLEDAKAAARQAIEHHFDSTYLHYNLYLVDFLQNDASGMGHEAAAIAGNPDGEDVLFYYESDTATYHGQFAQARELTRQAAAAASRAGEKEAPAAFTAEAAVREALVGNFAAAKQQAKAALALSTGKDVAAMSAIALGLAGDSATTASLADDLNKRIPRDTAVQYNFLPCIHAAVALRGGQPAKAIAALAVSSPHELGQTAQSVTFVLYPVYLRGEAYLASKQSTEASAEFQKILDHPGLVENEPIGSLAHWELPELLPERTTRPKPKRVTPPSSHFGKTPTPTCPSCSKPNQNARVSIHLLQLQEVPCLIAENGGS